MTTALSSTEMPGATALQGKVLFVEDEPVSFAIVQAMLSGHEQLQLTQAETGHQGVSLARSERPDAILLDMHLPDISGIEVVRRLSEDIAAGAFRVIIVTGDPRNIDVLKAMSLGAFEYLIKPVDRQRLEASLGRALALKMAKPSPR